MLTVAELRNRGNGNWQAVLYAGYTADGKHKRIYRTIKVDPNKTENAQRKLAERETAKLQADFDRHLLTDSKKMKLSAVCAEYLESHNMAESTRLWYKGCFNRIIPALGNIYIQDLTPRDIRAFYKKLSNDKALTARSKTGKLSGTYRLHHHRALSAVVGFALKSGYICANPMLAIDPPRADTPEAAFFEDYEIAQLMDVLENYPDPMWAAFFTLELFTSCRPGEVIGLNWSDLEDNVLHIRAGANRINGKTIRTAQPKNKSSKRPIILPPEVMKPLQKWRKFQNENKLLIGQYWPEESIDAMFTGDEGKRLDLSSPTQKWRKIQKKYNLKDVPLYSYRHTGASLLIAAGCDVKEVSARLGHSRASTTLDKYTHLFEKAAQHTTDAMTNAINNARLKSKQEPPEPFQMNG